MVWEPFENGFEVQEEIVMLVLTRKQGETIRIGDDIVLKVVGFAGNRVRLAFDAPSDIRILRGELTHSGAPSHSGAQRSTANSGTVGRRISQVPLTN